MMNNIEKQINKITNLLGDSKPELKKQKSLVLLENILKIIKDNNINNNDFIKEVDTVLEQVLNINKKMNDKGTALIEGIDKLNELTSSINKLCIILSNNTDNESNQIIIDSLKTLNELIKNIPNKVEISNLKEYPKDIRINNLNEVVEKLEVLIKTIEKNKPVEKEFPNSFEIKNLPKQIDKIEINKPVEIKNSIEIKKPKWYKNLDLTSTIKALKEDIEKIGNSLLDRLLKKNINVNVENKKAISVKIVDEKGKIITNFLKGFRIPSTFGGGDGICKRQIVDSDEKTIDPSTRQKQDDIITAINNISDNQVSTDLDGGGKILVGTTAVEVTFTGTTESIIITADIDNTGTLYIGKSNVASDGSNAIVPIEAGESVTIDYDDSSNSLYVVASEASQNFWKGALL